MQQRQPTNQSRKAGDVMFGKSKGKNDGNYNFAEAARGKKFPILILDEKWLELFPEHEMSSTVKDLCEQLRRTMAREGKLNTELKALKRYKSQLMQEIVDNMEVDNSKLGILKAKKLEKNQRLIVEVKEKIAETEEQLADIPLEIRELNNELMVESSNECYRRMSENSTEIRELAEDISELKQELAAKTARKQEIEEVNNRMYSYMHNIYGAGIMEKLDELVVKLEKEQ